MTPEQQEAWNLVHVEGLNRAEAARKLGLPVSTFKSRLQRAEAYKETDPGVLDVMSTLGLIRPERLGQSWLKCKDGTVTVKPYKPTDDPNRIIDAIREGLEDMPRAPAVRATEGPSDLCAVFPVADLHMGLLTDEEEVGEDWDTKTAARVFEQTFGALVDRTPEAGEAVLAQLGDLTHNDDQRNVTPQSQHQLDVDSRFFVILRRALSVMKWAIDRLRQKYPRVIYRGARGNHDITTHYAITLALSEHYRDVGGVEIIDNASEFYVHEFGANMTMLCHGDKAKPDRLVNFAAAQFPEIWGRTKFRRVLTGHVHHARSQEIGGMTFESFNTIAPRDAYAFSGGYFNTRCLTSILLHERDGEVARARVGIQ